MPSKKTKISSDKLWTSKNKYKREFSQKSIGLMVSPINLKSYFCKNICARTKTPSSRRSYKRKPTNMLIS